MQAADDTVRGKCRERRRGLLLAVLFVVLFGCLSLLMSLVADEEISRTASSTATVSGGTSRSNEGTQVCKGADVAFTVDGADYGGNQSVDGPCPADGGATRVAIRYDPGDPSSFDDGEVDWGVFVVLGAFVIGLLISGWAVARNLWLRWARPITDDEPGAVPI